MCTGKTDSGFKKDFESTFLKRRDSPALRVRTIVRFPATVKHSASPTHFAPSCPGSLAIKQAFTALKLCNKNIKYTKDYK